MKRLTEWRNGHGAIVNHSENYIDKLARYEDAEEQGRLIILPNKIGDHVFLAYRGRVEELEIENVTDNMFYTRNVETDDRSVNIHPNDFGRFIFQTREEAEKALSAVK